MSTKNKKQIDVSPFDETKVYPNHEYEYKRDGVKYKFVSAHGYNHRYGYSYFLRNELSFTLKGIPFEIIDGCDDDDRYLAVGDDIVYHPIIEPEEKDPIWHFRNIPEKFVDYFNKALKAFNIASKLEIKRENKKIHDQKYYNQIGRWEREKRAKEKIALEALRG